MNTWRLDLAVTGVSYVDNDPAKGSEISIANLDKLVMPATVEVDFADGNHRRIRLPVAAWMTRTSLALPLDSTQPISKVVIDPDAVIPDCDRTNNVWKASP